MIEKMAKENGSPDCLSKFGGAVLRVVSNVFKDRIFYR